MSELSEQMIQDMRARGLSPRTQASYVDAVRRLARRYRRSPGLISQREVQAHLLESCDRGLSWSTVNGQACAMRFFCWVPATCSLASPLPVSRNLISLCVSALSLIMILCFDDKMHQVIERER